MITRDEFNAFSRLVLDLHRRWHQYCALYAGDDVAAKLALMNETAPTFFEWDRDVWLDGIFLSISRLMDRPCIMGKKTLGLAGVLELVDEPIKSKLEPLVQDIKCIHNRGIKDWRNNRLSHNNWEYHLGLTLLPDVPLADVEAIVLKFEQLINNLSFELYEETGGYSELEVRKGADSLLAALKKQSAIGG
jgi:hypothetical protein